MKADASIRQFKGTLEVVDVKEVWASLPLLEQDAQRRRCLTC